MSRQILSLQDDWEEVRERFRDHFDPENLEIGDEKVKYSSSGEHLEIRRDGELSAGMPLHSNEMENADRIEISESEVKVFSRDGKYAFRR